MKHLKLFNDTASYDTWKNSEDFVLPNVSYTEDGNLYYNAYGEPVNPNVVCTYNVTDTSGETQILTPDGLSCFSSMIVDGVGMDTSDNYQFDTVGNHVVEFILDDPTVIGSSAFEACSSLTSVIIPDSVTIIGERAFSHCGLTSVTIPDSVTEIGSGVFAGCSEYTGYTTLKSFNGKFASEDGRCLIKDGVLIAFASVGLTSYTIPDSVTIIGEFAFDCCNLTSVTIPNSVTIIEGGAFNNCGSLTSITIPNSVNSIGEFAFNGCNNITSVIIGNGITNIGKMAFAFCRSLTSITCYAPTSPSIQSANTFFMISNSGTLYVPTGSDYSSWMSTDILGNWTIQYI